MSSSSRVPLLVGSKGRKPSRLPIAPRARPSNVDRVKRVPTRDDANGSERTTTLPQPPLSPEREALPPVLPVVAPIQLPVTSVAHRAGGISPGHAISAARAVTSVRPQHVGGAARSPLLMAVQRNQESVARSPAQRSPAQPVERLAKISSASLFRSHEGRSHASPILGPRATSIPAKHVPHAEPHEQNPLLKRMARKLDIKPHQSPRRAALNQHPPPVASPLVLATPTTTAVPEAPLSPLEQSKELPKKRGTKRRKPESTQENANTSNEHTAQRRSLRRKVKKEHSYKDPSDSLDEPDNGDDDDYEQQHDDADDADDHLDSVAGLDLPEYENPKIYMPARERATLWAKKVLRQQEEADNGDGSDAKALVVKKEKPIRRKRSNSSSSVASSTTSSRKSKAEELLKKEPSQMTMGELALSIPKGRRMHRHEQEESADHHHGPANALNRVRSMSMSSESTSFGGSIVTPQVEIIDGKMVILESTVKLPDQPSFADQLHDFQDDSARRPRGSRYLAANNTPGRRWSKDETKQFYYCLSQVGPNFSMMATLFPTRKRKELKCKFKYEEKHHPGLIEIALKASAAPLDSEIVDVIAQMVDKETKKKEAKRRKHSDASLEDGLHSPATVSSSVVPTPPPAPLEYAEEPFGDYYRERKGSFDFSG